MIVMKFGGASLSTTEGILKACQIVKDYRQRENIVLVVSAMKGVTDKLFEITELLRHKKIKAALTKIEELKENHLHTFRLMNNQPQGVKIESELINSFSRLYNFVKNVSKKEMTASRVDYIVSFGERFSCPIVSYALETSGVAAYPIDASFIIATNDNFGNALPLYKKSQHHINEILFPLIKSGIIPVITGYIGFAHDGCTTTLGRGGSDLSAAYLANLLDAKGLYLWKDVDGFYTNDPHKDQQARLLKQMSYEKAARMARNGAKIIYHKAITPVKKKNIPIYIKSFLHPETAGTVISN